MPVLIGTTTTVCLLDRSHQLFAKWMQFGMQDRGSWHWSGQPVSWFAGQKQPLLLWTTKKGGCGEQPPLSLSVYWPSLSKSLPIS